MRLSLQVSTGLLVAGMTLSCSKKVPAPPRAHLATATPHAAATPAQSVEKPERAPAPIAGPLRYIVVGGGATPESTEVSLEQDVEQVRESLPGPGIILFAGGTDSNSVRELDPEPHGDALLVELGALFNPRAGRSSHYREPKLVAERASVENVERKLTFTLDEVGPPLLLYVAAHGDQGETPRDNSVALWGGRPLTVARLAELDERHSRPLRLVATSCFSGGFADLAFAHADPHAGPSRVLRCGLFAGTWDRETSGCDANPDRRAQESYGVHFARALAKKDRSGAPLAPGLVDFDHDGRVTLLEAHTRARIAARSFDVPTTTSERWLRSAEHGTAPIDPKILPEDYAVTIQLGQALGLKDEASTVARWNELDKKLGALDDAMDDAEDDLAAKEAELASRLLERWPMLDDPFHPDFATTFEKNRAAIKAVLERSNEARDRADARDEVDHLDLELSTLEVEEARVLRLKRAYETLHLAAALTRRGGAAAKYYETLLACERTTP